MSRHLRRLHPVAGIAAMGLIALFLASSVAAELTGDAATIARTKTWIVRAIPFLVVALAIAGATGLRLGRASRHPDVRVKKRRMPLVAANGLLVLVPLAWLLADRAAAGTIDATFHILQAAEFVAGAINLTLLGLMARDGRRIARGRAHAAGRRAGQPLTSQSMSKTAGSPSGRG